MRFLLTLGLMAVSILSPAWASSGVVEHSHHPIDNMPVELEIDGIRIKPGNHIVGALHNIPFSIVGSDATYIVEVFYNGENRPDLVADSTLLMPLAGPFSGTYRIDVSDMEGRHYLFFIDRPLLLTTDAEPLLQGSNTSRLIIAGAPAGTGINLAGDSSIQFINATGDTTSYIEAPDLPDLFNATAVLIHSSEPGTHTLHAFAPNTPDSAIKVLTVSKRAVSVTVTNADGEAIPGAQIIIADPRMKAWGLEGTYITDQFGSAVLDLPAVMLKKTSSAVGYHVNQALIQHDQNELNITLANNPTPYSLTGAITSDGGDFGNEQPTISITLSDSTIVRIQPDKFVSTHFHFAWKRMISPDAKPKVLTILHSGHKTKTINLDISATEDHQDIYLTPHNDPLQLNGGPDTAMILSGVEVTSKQQTTGLNASNPAQRNTQPQSGYGSMTWWFILVFSTWSVLIRRFQVWR